jgi:O-antigen ligase
MFWVGGEPLAERIGSIRDETGAELIYVREGSRRMDIWQATSQLIRDNPVAGSGLGAFWVAIAMYHDASGVATPQQAHNDYLELLAGGGIIGLALAGWFVIKLSKNIRTQLVAPDNYRRAACLGAICGMFGVAVHSFMDFGLHITINALVFTALIVIATVDFRFSVYENDVRVF